jgi:hypothetical protein
MTLPNGPARRIASTIRSVWFLSFVLGVGPAASFGDSAVADLIVLNESGGLVGGRRQQVKVLQLTENNAAKFWVEDSDDNLFEVRTGTVDTHRLFTDAEQATRIPIETAGDPSPRPPDLLPEYYPPQTALRIRIARRDWTWSGRAEDLPAQCRQLLFKLRALPQTLHLHQPVSPERFLRCELLTTNTIPYLREADLIRDLSTEELASRPLLREAVHLETALLPIDRNADPLADLRRPRSGPTRAYIVVVGQCYLLRLLTYNPITGQVPGKETTK